MNMRHRFEVRVPPEAAFAFFSDPNRAFERLGTNLHVQWLEPIGPGARYLVDAPNAADDCDGVVDAYEPPRRLSIRMWPRRHPDRGGITTMEFEPTPTGTLIKGVLTNEMSGSLELGALLLKPFIAAISRRGMQRMASVLEADYQAGRLPT